MKTGIITLNGNKNYGNKLQNYALKTTLEKLNCDTDTLWLETNKEKTIRYIKEIIKFTLMHTQYKREKIFKQFNKDYLNVKYTKLDKKINNLYNYFIVGSDQVWNWSFDVNFDTYFAKFSSKEKNISYAASFGLDYIKDDLKDTYKNGLNNFNYISVREDRGKELVEELTVRKDAEVVLDPTMLLTEEEWEKIIKKPKKLISKKYILTYFLGELSTERQEEIKRIAKENNCDIIDALDKKGDFYTIGPSEFLYLEKNAFLICTDSFHSCVFALIFNRPFVIFDREDKEIKMNSRIETLLSKFELENRKYEGKIIDKNLKHNYKKAYKVLEKEREKSIIFLKKALNINNK